MQCHGADPLAQAASAPGDVMKQVRAPFLDRQVHQLTHLDSRHLSDATPQRRLPSHRLHPLGRLLCEAQALTLTRGLELAQLARHKASLQILGAVDGMGDWRARGSVFGLGRAVCAWIGVNGYGLGRGVQRAQRRRQLQLQRWRQRRLYQAAAIGGGCRIDLGSRCIHFSRAERDVLGYRR